MQNVQNYAANPVLPDGLGLCVTLCNPVLYSTLPNEVATFFAATYSTLPESYRQVLGTM